MKPKYFLVLKDSVVPQIWSPGTSTSDLPHDLRYYGRVFQEMEKHLFVPDLRFYVTWNNEELPEYGSNIVVLLLGEEIGLMPRYGRHVRAVIKTMEGTTPELVSGRRWPLSKIDLLLRLKHLRNLALSSKSWQRARRFSNERPPVRNEPFIILTPLGYALLDELPLKKMSQRPYHCFYAGNTQHIIAGAGYRKLLSSPKTLVRTEMWKALHRLIEKRSDFRFDGNTTDSASANSNPRTYSERMMDAKICLAPRGSSIHTWRFFEGVKSGSLVVTNRLPVRHYYQDAPVIELDNWNELEKKIAPYLENEELLEQEQKKTLEYWQSKCSEDAIGRYIAHCLNKDRDISV